MIVVGVGRGRSHLHSFLALPDQFDVVGLVDLDAERLQNTLSELDLPADLGYTSYDDALLRSNCDGVMIATSGLIRWAADLRYNAPEAGDYGPGEAGFLARSTKNPGLVLTD